MPTKHATRRGAMRHLAHTPADRDLAIVLTLAFLILAIWVHRPIQAAENSHYRLVENWVHFPPEVTKWGQATGVDVDSHDNVFVFHRNELMTIMAFDKRGNFIRAWGRGIVTQAHFLRGGRSEGLGVH